VIAFRFLRTVLAWTWIIADTMISATAIGISGETEFSERVLRAWARRFLRVAGARVIEPLGIGPIPVDRFAYPFFEADLGVPTKFKPNFRTVQRVAAIMARAILDKLHEGLGFAQGFEDGANDPQIGLRHAGRHIVDCTSRGFFDRQMDGAAVILHEQPVTLLQAIPVNRKRLILARIGNDQRN